MPAPSTIRRPSVVYEEDIAVKAPLPLDAGRRRGSCCTTIALRICDFAATESEEATFREEEHDFPDSSSAPGNYKQRFTFKRKAGSSSEESFQEEDEKEEELEEDSGDDDDVSTLTSYPVSRRSSNYREVQLEI